MSAYGFIRVIEYRRGAGRNLSVSYFVPGCAGAASRGADGQSCRLGFRRQPEASGASARPMGAAEGASGAGISTLPTATEGPSTRAKAIFSGAGSSQTRRKG